MINERFLDFVYYVKVTVNIISTTIIIYPGLLFVLY